MMTGYSIGLFFHFVGMVGVFVGYGLEWTGSSHLRRATNVDQARAALGLYKLSLPISGPALLLLILSGGYLASLAGGMGQAWILGAWVGIVVALLIGFVLVLPRMKKIRAALAEGSAAPAVTEDPMIATLIRVRFMLALGIVALMTYKPATLATALLVLAGAVVVGASCAVTLWTKK
jgi:hypothetical protein